MSDVNQRVKNVMRTSSHLQQKFCASIFSSSLFYLDFEHPKPNIGETTFNKNDTIMIGTTNNNQPSASKPSFNISRRINVCKTASPANTSVSALASRVVYSTAILLLLVAPLGKYILCLSSYRFRTFSVYFHNISYEILYIGIKNSLFSIRLH